MYIFFYLILLSHQNLNLKLSHSISELAVSSTILAKNSSYATHLLKFLEPAVGNNSQWKLCYRASFDGWDAFTFHSLCDGKKNTVTIVESNQYVFGGYTDAPWGNLPCYLLIQLHSCLPFSLGVCLPVSKPVCLSISHFALVYVGMSVSQSVCIFVLATTVLIFFFKLNYKKGKCGVHIYTPSSER